MTTITQQDRDAVLAIMDKVRASLASDLEKANASPVARKIVVAEQSMRVCLETSLKASLPYSEQFIGEMAVRLAAYCLTAAPITSHGDLARLVAGALPEALAAKVRQGFVIRTEWDMG